MKKYLGFANEDEFDDEDEDGESEDEQKAPLWG